MASNEDTEPIAGTRLQSEEQRELLDAVDRLRNVDITADLEVPQILVCGDQSSGKSSVLEAIAGVSFPRGFDTVTRFPTEVILRKTAETQISVKIRPDSNGWTRDQTVQIRDWQLGSQVHSAEDVHKVIDAAKTFLQSIDPLRNFWYDLLQIELSGPGQPHLTLIDLPGLIQNDAQQSSKDKILKLTERYIGSKGAVILAVIDAPTDLERHQIIQLLQDSGAIHRTMGILTMPDKLHSGSDQEAARVRMVIDEGGKFGFGWHVLRNLPHEITDRSPDLRDKGEKDFFAKLPWSRLPVECVGAPSLRKKVSEQLLVRIQLGLPRLITEMETELRKREEILQRLGEARETDEEKRKYLLAISERLVPVIRSALQGEYWAADVEHFFQDKDERRLREVINFHTDTFASTMRVCGRLYRIRDDIEAEAGGKPLLESVKRPGIDDYARLPANTPVSFSADDSTVYQRYTVSFGEYTAALASHISRTRGLNLRGTVPAGVYKAIFRQQSRPWRSIVDQCKDSCEYSIRLFLREACYYVAGAHGGAQLMDHLILPHFRDRVRKLEDKVDELLWPYVEGHPMICDDRFNAFSVAGSLYCENGELWADKLPPTATAAEMAAAKAMDTADVYYNVALRTLVENVAGLAVERCLLHGLGDVASPSTLQALSLEEVYKIANERDSDSALRAKSRTQKKTLTEVLRICRTHNGGRSISGPNLGAHRLPVRSAAMSSALSKTQTDPAETFSWSKQSANSDETTNSFAEPFKRVTMPGDTGISTGGSANMPKTNNLFSAASKTDSLLADRPQSASVFGATDKGTSVFGGVTKNTNFFSSQPNSSNLAGGPFSSFGKSAQGSSLFSAPSKSDSPFTFLKTAASTQPANEAKQKKVVVKLPVGADASAPAEGTSEDTNKSTNKDTTGEASGRSLGESISFIKPFPRTSLTKMTASLFLTVSPPFHIEIDLSPPEGQVSYYQSISAHPHFIDVSHEEIRLADENHGHVKAERAKPAGG